jgi:hypothetical protein
MIFSLRRRMIIFFPRRGLIFSQGRIFLREGDYFGEILFNVHVFGFVNRWCTSDERVSKSMSSALASLYATEVQHCCAGEDALKVIQNQIYRVRLR